MIGYIHDDVFRQTRLLPTGVTVKVIFVRDTEQFSLILTKAGNKTELSSAILKKCKVNPEVCLALASVHKKNNMYFPIKRVDCKVFTIPSGSLSAFKEGIISGQLPKKILVGCVHNTAYNGVYNRRIRSTFRTLTSPTLTYTLTVSQTPCFLWTQTLLTVCTRGAFIPCFEVQEK